LEGDPTGPLHALTTWALDHGLPLDGLQVSAQRSSAHRPASSPLNCGESAGTAAEGSSGGSEFCPAIVFPTVVKGKARVRTIVTADHTDDDLSEALEVFGRVGAELGLR